MIDVPDNNCVYYYHFDGLGSVVALSDTSGDIVERYEYDIFGDPNRVSSIGNPYFFTGRRLDCEAGLYYYRARYYKPDIGRFLQTDPIGYDDSMNLYQYCLNNPINRYDLFGNTSSAVSNKVNKSYNQLREIAGVVGYMGPWDASQTSVHARETIMWSDSHGARIVSEALLKEALANPNITTSQIANIRIQQGDITNALRHAYLAAKLYRYETENDAEQALLVHEAVWGGDLGGDIRDMEADMWNNAIGMQIGLGKGNIIEEVLKAYYEGSLASWTGGTLKPLLSNDVGTNKCTK